MEGVIGEIRLWAATFEPQYWAFCNGRLLPISYYTPLFALIGTMYGGDGKTTFGLPDLQGRVPIAAGQGPLLPVYQQGQLGGLESAELMVSQLPTHQHLLRASSQAGTIAQPSAAYPAGSNVRKIYGTTANGVMTTTAPQSASAPPLHNNMMPYLCCNYIICVQGMFPYRP